MTLPHSHLIKVTLVTGALLISATGLDLLKTTFFEQPRFRLSPVAQAQNYDEEKLEQYAEAVLAIEPLRQRVFRKIQSILNSENVPSIACNRTESYENLPSEAQSLIVDYCNRSKSIVEEQGLTVSEFNNITVEVKANPELEQQVQTEMLELR